MLRSLKIKALACVANLFGRAKTGGLGQVTTKKKKTRKAPGGVNPAVVLSALGVQNILRPGKSC